MSKERTPDQKPEREQRLEKLRLEILDLLEGSKDEHEEEVYDWAMRGLLASGTEHLGLISGRIDSLKTDRDADIVGSLRTNESDEATALLIKMLGNRSQWIRGRAACILAARPSEELVTEIKGYLFKKSRVAQKAGLEFLGALSSRHVSYFMQAMDEETVERLEWMGRRYGKHTSRGSKAAKDTALSLLRWWREEQQNEHD